MYPVIMLMKVVFPAPLVPIRPTTASFSNCTEIFSAAVTAPKFLWTAFRLEDHFHFKPSFGGRRRWTTSPPAGIR